jgi:predicted nucleic acid-binding Zn ribbon protein
MTLEPLGEEVRRELGRFGPEASLGAVVEAWPEAVGSQIAANAWPGRIARDGTLHVATSSSAWAFELTQLEERVRRALAKRLGAEAPRRLRFAAGPLPERGAESVEITARNRPEPNSEARAEGRRIAAPISDPELRGLVARAAAASLSEAPADR